MRYLGAVALDFGVLGLTCFGGFGRSSGFGFGCALMWFGFASLVVWV